MSFVRGRTAWILGAVVLLIAALVGTSMLMKDSPTKIDAIFASSIGLYPGNDVQVLGVPIGKVTAVKPVNGQVRVSMQIDAGQSAAPDTKAVIVAPTLVSDRFVQLTEPWDGGPKIRSGTVIPRADTAVPAEIDELYASLDDIGQKLGPNGVNKHGALSRFLDVAAANLKGQGTDINTMINEFGKATSTLSNSDEDFFKTLANLKAFNDMLVANDESVSDVNKRFAAVTGYLAEDRDELAQAVRNLGGALGILDDFIRENRADLKSSVEQMKGPTAVLARQQKSLEESIRMAPLVLQNFLNAYNAKTGTLDGRGNLNEFTIWARDGLNGRTSAAAPPTMFQEGGR